MNSLARFSSSYLIISAPLNHYTFEYNIKSTEKRGEQEVKSFSMSSQTLEELQGLKANQNIFILARLISLLYQRVNPKKIRPQNVLSLTLKKQYKKTPTHLNELKEYAEIIKRLNQKWSSTNLMKSTKALWSQPLFSDFFDMSPTYNIKNYTEMAPRIPPVQQSIVPSSRFKQIASMAAREGKAFSKGLASIISTFESKEHNSSTNTEGTKIVFLSSSFENKMVFLRPSFGVVYKKMDRRSKEEEALIHHLFNLSNIQGTVGCFHLTRFAFNKWDITSQEQESLKFPSKDYKSYSLQNTPSQDINFSPVSLNGKTTSRSYSLQELRKEKNDLLRDNISRKLSSSDRKIYEQLEKQWDIKLRKEVGNEIEKKWGNEELSDEAHEKIYNELYQEKKRKRTNDSFPTIHFIPRFQDENLQAHYSYFEELKWRYKERVVDFKTIQTAFLKGNASKNISPIKEFDLNQETNKEKWFLVLDAIFKNLSWQMILPDELYYLNSTTGYSPLKNFSIKEFIPHMLSLHSLISDPKLLLAITSRLNEGSKMTAVKSGGLQPFDLHENNIWAAPVFDEEYKQFKQATFSYSLLSSKKVIETGFYDLHLNYLKGYLDITQKVHYTIPNKTSKTDYLDHLTDLNTALNSPWRWVTPDTGSFLGESSGPHKMTIHFKDTVLTGQHINPFRSAFLSLDWKDEPLSPSNLAQLENSEKEDQQIRDWILQKDAPIRKFLSPSASKRLDTYLHRLLKDQKYSLSYQKQNTEEPLTVKKLRKSFISDLMGSNYQDFWLFLEKELKRDLTSPNKEVTRKRLKIGAQLFPRSTWKQAEALIERQEKQKNYLNNYNKIKSLASKEAHVFLDEIKAFINADYCPLSSLQKQTYLKTLERDQQNVLAKEELNSLKENILKECQPTYFNLMKAMYPTLADVYHLAELITGSSLLAGRLIGDYTCPIEELLERANQAQTNETQLLASSIKEHLNKCNETETADLGQWAFPKTKQEYLAALFPERIIE